jgi:hypothetical protein
MIGVGGKWAILGEIVASSKLYPMDINSFPERRMRTNNSPIGMSAIFGCYRPSIGQNGSGNGVLKSQEEFISY